MHRRLYAIKKALYHVARSGLLQGDRAQRGKGEMSMRIDEGGGEKAVTEVEKPSARPNRQIVYALGLNIERPYGVNAPGLNQHRGRLHHHAPPFGKDGSPRYDQASVWRCSKDHEQSPRLVIPTRSKGGKAHPGAVWRNTSKGIALLWAAAAALSLGPTPAWGQSEPVHEDRLSFRLEGDTIVIDHLIRASTLETSLGPRDEAKAPEPLAARVHRALRGPWSVEVKGRALSPRLLDLSLPEAKTSSTSSSASIRVRARFVFPPSSRQLRFRWPKDRNAPLQTRHGVESLELRDGFAEYRLKRPSVPTWSWALFILAGIIIVAAVTGRLLRGRSV